MADHTLVFIVLGLTLAAFVWGRFRYDLVALAALVVSVILGLVPGEEAFYGFGHPAVITVAAVLVLSRGFERSGVVDVIDHLFRTAGKLLYILVTDILSCGSVPVVFLFFFLMIAGSCFSLFISNPWSSWHFPCLVQRWHSPLQRP
ncbi:SLC13 family permease, partial [Billgrantia desiderata]|uniref:SLC13 family permease n=1 Tax=Billgrantia desiderata TaxID=52021 RepID=UPI003F40E3F1